MNWFIDTFRHFGGLDDGSGAWYLFHSGFGANFGLYAAALVFYWHHTCHVGRCWRFGRHKVDGTPFATCRHHHPAIEKKRVTAEIIHAAHHLHLSGHTRRSMDGPEAQGRADP